MPDPLRIRPADDYVFNVDVEDAEQFQGPMDLLLKLIEREELPITGISLVQVTQQYLDHLAQLEELRPDGIAEFLVMAARLIYIKSVALLPRVELENEDEEEDPAEALARQLREYKLFKEKAALLKQLEARGQRGYVRLAPPPKLEKRLDPSGLDVNTLLDAVYELLQELDVPPRPVHSMAPLTITVDDCREALKERLLRGQTVRFRQFLGRATSRSEVLVNLLAILEMIKLGEIRVQQEGLFGEIVIEGMQRGEIPVDTL